MSTFKRVSGNLIFQTLGNTDQFVFQGPVANAATVVIDGNLTVSGNATLSGNISGDKLFNGTTSIEIQSAGGNANVTVGNVSNVAVFASTGLFINGNANVTSNISANNLTVNSFSAGSVAFGNVSATGNITISRDAAAGQPTFRFNDTDTDVAANTVVGSIEWFTNDVTSPGARITTAIRSTYTDSSGNTRLDIFTGTTTTPQSRVTVLPTGNVGIANTSPTTLFSVDGTAYISGATTVAANITGGNILTGGQVSAAGNITGGNIRTGGQVSAAGNITGGNLSVGGKITAGATGISTTGNVDGGNLNSSGNISSTGTITVGGNVLTQGQISTSANIVGNNISAGNNISTTVVSASGNIVAAANVSGANLISSGIITATSSVQAGNLLTAGQVSATGNITSQGYFVGDGGFLSNITAISNVTTSQISNGTTSLSIAGSNGNLIGTISGVANVLVATPQGLSVGGTLSSTGNVTAGNLSTGIISATGNISGGNVSGSTGTFTSVLGNINANLLVAGTVSSDRLSGSYTINISGSAATAGTVTTNAQPNITSVGTLSNVSVSGNIIGNGSITITSNVSAGNLQLSSAANIDSLRVRNDTTTGGSISSAGNITAANLRTGGSVSSSGNVIAGNVQGGANVNATTHTGNTVSVTANITGGNIISGALITAAGSIQGNAASFTSNISAGNILTGGQISAAGNITGSNLSISGIYSVAGNIIGGNILTGGQVSAGANVIAGNILTGGLISAAGNITVGNLTTATVSCSSITKTGTNAVGNIGSSSNYFNRVFATATTALYADLAEKYSADADYEPGTVVSFGGSAEITKSLSDGDQRVAGVISAKPSYLMNSGLTSDHVATVALQGRVPCKVQGPVCKGDMMVSNGQGAARAESNPKPGSVIGKSLEDFNEQLGMIEIVVGRL